MSFRTRARQAGPYIFLALAFLVPCAILAAAYWVMKIHPFGHRSILVIDLDAQYVDFYAALRRMVFAGESPFYSWGKMLGGNMLGIVSYYLTSPFSIIPLLFPERALADAIYWMTLAKVGGASLAMAVYLWNSLKARGWPLVIFSTPYALMAYVGMYSYNIMWLDGLIFLPLIAFGIEKIALGESARLYTFALAVMLVANYYIGYMLCIFSALYFLYQSWLCFPGGGSSRLLRRAGLFAASSLLAVGSAAFLLLPTYFTLSAGKLGFDREMFGLIPQFHPLDLPPKLLVGSYDTALGHLPNIYSGLAMSLLAGLYFLNRQSPARGKVGAAALLGLLLLSFYWSGLDLVWHGFQIPNSFPYRYSFLFSFLIITLAYQGYQGLSTLSWRRVLAAGLVGGAVVALAAAHGAAYIPLPLLVASLGLLCVYTAIFWMMHRGTSLFMCLPAAALVWLLAGIVLFEAGVNTLAYVRAIHREFQYRDRTAYQGYVDQVGLVIQQLKEADPAFYRIEKTFHRSSNDALSLDYPALTHFSSSVERPTLVFARQLGFLQAFYRLVYTGQTLPMDSILGIKYVLSDQPMHQDYAPVGRYPVNVDQVPGGEITAYENPYALPLGFMVQPELAELHLDRYNPLFWQDQILRAMAGSPDAAFLTPLVVETVETSNISFSQTTDGWLAYSRLDPEADAVIEYHLLVQAEGPAYAFLVARDQSKMEVILGDRVLGHVGENSENNHVLLLGDYPPGSRITVKIRLLWSEAILMNDSLFYQLDIARFRQAYQEFAANALEISAFTDTTITGRVSAIGSKTLLFTSIPYDPAWRVLMDGQRVETIRLLDTFLGLQIPPGTHELRFEYHPRGWAAGWLITALSLVTASVFLCKQKRGFSFPRPAVKSRPRI